MAPLAVALKDKIPVIEKIVRIDYNMGGGNQPFCVYTKG